MTERQPTAFDDEQLINTIIYLVGWTPAEGALFEDHPEVDVQLVRSTLDAVRKYPEVDGSTSSYLVRQPITDPPKRAQLAVLDRQLTAVRRVLAAAFKDDVHHYGRYLAATSPCLWPSYDVTNYHGPVYLLELQDGMLQGFTETVRRICELKTLRTLHLFGNGLTEMPFRCAGLDDLRLLGLAQNAFDHVPDSLLDFPALEHLDLSDNQIQFVPPWVGRMTSLRFLLLDGNPLRDLPSELAQLPNLMVLDVSGTRIPAFRLRDLKQRLPRCRVVADAEY